MGKRRCLGKHFQAKGLSVVHLSYYPEHIMSKNGRGKSGKQLLERPWPWKVSSHSITIAQ